MKALGRLLLASVALLVGCTQAGEQGARSIACFTPQAIPAALEDVQFRLTGDPGKDAALLARSLDDAKVQDRKLLDMLADACRREQGRHPGGAACARLSAVPASPMPVRQHLSNHAVEDTLLLAMALREWQNHANIVRAALPVCEQAG